MILNCGSLLLLGILLIQSNDAASPDGFSIAERLQLSSKIKIEDRIKIYQSASDRYRKSVQQAAGKQEFQRIPDILRSWTSVISKSLADISQNIDRKKKSNALIKFEIQLRKSIVDIRSVRIRAAVEDQESYDDWISHAEKVRAQFVDILFPK
jgi:hypothetical protein